MSVPHILLVSAPYYADLTESLESHARTKLTQAGARHDIIHVPGVLEIPAAIRLASQTPKPYDGYVALGVVIRGATAHFDIVAQQSAAGLMQLGVQHGLAIGNGILTVENRAQAQERLSKGADAVQACLSLFAIRAQQQS